MDGLPSEEDTAPTQSAPRHDLTSSAAPSQDASTAEKESSLTRPAASPAPSTAYLRGLKLHMITSALCLCLFLTNIEIPIVSTALVGITDDLHGFKESSWIVTAYLLTYIGFLIIWSKLSDIFGRRLTVTISVFIFVVFSGACGAAQTIIQLIVFRAFQGIGGSGIYAICIPIFFELVPPEKFAAYTSLVSVVFVLSLLLGPILGGVITKQSTWRWVFLFNVPAGVIGMLVLVTMIPPGFPRHGQSSTKSRSLKQVLSKTSLRKLDFIGAGLLLTATLLLITALEEAGVRFAWRSPFVITLLIVSGLLWLAFLAWEFKVTRAETVREPVFPWRFIQSRIWIGMLLNAFFLGAPFNVVIFSLPQRFQIVNSTSPLGAGVRLLPFTCATPVGSLLSSLVAGKMKVPPIYLVITASCLQVVGFSLLSTLPVVRHISTAQYGYEVIAGFGVGINISTLVLMTPFSVQKRDQAVALGSVAQFRYMGGAIGLAIVTSILYGFVSPKLLAFLPEDQVSALLQTSAVANSLPPEHQETVRAIFGRAYNIQMRILIGLAAAQLPSSALMWQKKQIVV